tara:strand:+ start:3899 stop:6223 length:2325 start_codon:yes stop_codon:yes gene_type:complete
MATTEEFKNGGATSYTFSIEYIKASDIKVKIDGAAQTYTTNASPSSGQYKVVSTTVTLGAASASGTGNVHIYRETDLDTAAAVFAAGSSIRASDLNAIHDLTRLASQEQNQIVTEQDIRDSAVTSAKIKDGEIVNADINASAAIAQSKIATGTLPSGIQVNSDNIVNGSIVDADISNSAAINHSKLSLNIVNADVNSGADIAGSKLANDSVALTKLGGGALPTDITVSSTNLVDGTIVDADINASAQISFSKLATGTLPSAIKVDTNNITTGTLDNRYYTESELDGGQLNSLYFTESELTGGAVDGRYYTETELDAGQLDNRYYTETELNAGQLDNRYYTETESEALFLRQDSSETIASGVTWSASDTKVATTSAIDARIVDLIDDVGGFVPIANETSFPNANPDVNNGTGTLISIKALASNLTSNGSGVATIANGTVGNSTVTINGLANSTTYLASFGMIVETTTTLNTYTFHRYVPKATEVNVVASNITNINACGSNLTDIENFADLYQIANSAPTQRADGGSLTIGDLWFDNSANQVMMVYDGSAGDGFSPITPSQSTITNINSVSGYVTYQEDLGSITDAVNTGSGNNSINTVGAAIANVNTTATNIAKINTVADDLNEGTSEIDTVATNIANVNTVGAAITAVNAVSSNATNINAVHANASNINTVAGVSANVTTVAGSIADVNRYAAEYLIQSGTPGSPSAGDLWYNSTANTLNYYSGSTWIGIAPGIAGLINDANPALANHLDCNDKNLTEVGTVSGNNLQIDFGTL